MKILTVVGTRPQFLKLAPYLKRFKEKCKSYCSSYRTIL